MPCGKYKKIRAKDVGRPGHHYIKVGVKKGGGSERIGGLRTYKYPSGNPIPASLGQKIEREAKRLLKKGSR